MGAIEAILGLGALLGVGYYVIQLANKTPISIPFITPDVSALAVPPLPTPAVVPPSPSTSSATDTTKPKSSSSNKKQPEVTKEEILTPNTSEMTSPNVAGTSFTFNVVGDIDYYEGTGQNLCGDNPTVALIIGDFSYDCNSQKWWTTTMKACNGKKVLGSVGNHDCSGKGFIDLFPLNGGKWEFIYKIGNIAFIAVNTGYCSAQCMNLNSEALFKQAQADPSVKWIVAHFHKPVFTSGTAPDAPMSLHNMMRKYSKVKMAFAGHNHTYKRYVPQGGIQYITAGRGGHDAAKGSNTIKKGPDSGTVGVVKCRVDANGGISCQYVANSGEILDSWGLTADGRHTGTGGVVPKGGTASGESAYVQAFYTQFINDHLYDFSDKEDRDNAFIFMMDKRNAILYPQRQFNNKIYHYSKYARRY
jgi:calcineurin-like phosphoesterase family protein